MSLTPDQYVRAFSKFHEDLEFKIKVEVQQIVRKAGLGRMGVDPVLARDVVVDGLSSLISAYGPAAEAFGMYVFEEMVGESAAPAATTLPTATKAASSSAYGIITKYASPTTVLASSMTRHAMNFGRSAIHNSAARVPSLAYARVPNYRSQRGGKGPCEFCIVLASRGPVYADTVTAGERGSGNEYHDDCYCVPTLMRKGNPEIGDFGDPSDWPKGYTPDRLYREIYDPSHEYLDTIQDVTRKIRAKHPDFPSGR